MGAPGAQRGRANWFRQDVDEHRHRDDLIGEIGLRHRREEYDDYDFRASSDYDGDYDDSDVMRCTGIWTRFHYNGKHCNFGNERRWY